MPLSDPAKLDLKKLRVAFEVNNSVVPANLEVANTVRAAATALNGAVLTVAEDRPATLSLAREPQRVMAFA